ncbi:hypothetical protein GLOIN_2v1767205 [Rhizophagus irregularis DAOM 181602=DAOM 197198]|nr:hypothetical protein GLOIN_2v1767205 [Rhizophagus irregularis DAOM 181602=DAOM 197198]
MSVNCCLNSKNFAITILNDEQTQNPCFRCVCDGKDSGIQASASAAINNMYIQIFGNKTTKYSGLIVMGFDNEAIVRELVADVSFIPIFICLDKIIIVVSKIGGSSREGYYGAGPGYFSTLITKYAGKQSLFVQSIEDECSLDIYNEGVKLYHNKNTTPNKIWETIDIHKKYDGVALFGITDPYVQQKLEELNKLEKSKLEKSKNLITCTSDNWENIDILNLIFEQNIKKRKIATSTFSDWSNLFTNWDNLVKLFESEMLLVMEKKSQPNSESEKIWESLQKALEANKRGVDGKVGNNIINSARKYARLNGPGAPSLIKPKRTVKQMSEIKEKQFLMFFQDRSIVTQSSYQVDKNGSPILYMRDQKIKLWKKFEETFPNDQLRHLHRGYERELAVNADGTTQHNPCISHCLPYAFGKCLEKHKSRCSECDKFFEFFEFMHPHVNEDQAAFLEEIKEHLQYFLAHTTRKVYLNAQFKATLANLDENGALFIADYKMRILPRSARETKAEFFGKRGWTLHTILVFTKKNNCAEIISDNGAHYHSSVLMAIVSHWNEWYQIEVCDWQFLELGEAKTTIDFHHAAISHSIKRYIRIGYDIHDGEDIVEAAKHLSGTSLANLEPNRSQFGPEDENSNNVSKKELNTKPNVKTIKGISNLFYWKWPISGEMIGYICARSLPHFGPWNNFSPSAIANLCTKPIVRSHPKISEQTEPESSWTILLLDINSTSIPEFMDNNNSSDELEDVSSVDANFQFSMGWALKSNQKLGGKGKGKRMKKKVKELLKSFFLNGNLNQKDKMSAKEMYNELLIFVESGELEADDIPKIATIQNWISTYTRTFKEQATENMVNNAP